MFKVLGIYFDLSVFELLVLVDMVPIFDVDRVLELLSGRIDRIEVVAAQCVRGDIVFGVIISFFSKNRDMAGINLPSAGRFINYDMLNPDSFAESPDPDNQQTPMLGNCLYWNPGLKLKGTRSEKISVNTGDRLGAYRIIVSYVDAQGHESTAVSDFSIN